MTVERSRSPVRAQCKSASVVRLQRNRRISVAVRLCGTATARYGKTYVEWKAIGFATRRGDRARSSAQRRTPSHLRPRIRRDYPLNLSILLSGGKETNKDSLSNGE